MAHTNCTDLRMSRTSTSNSCTSCGPSLAGVCVCTADSAGIAYCFLLTPLFKDLIGAGNLGLQVHQFHQQIAFLRVKLHGRIHELFFGSGSLNLAVLLQRDQPLLRILQCLRQLQLLLVQSTNFILGMLSSLPCFLTTCVILVLGRPPLGDVGFHDVDLDLDVLQLIQDALVAVIESLQ